MGNLANKMRYQGSGSSHINPTKLVNPSAVLTSTADVAEADVALVFTGLPPEYESEGFDRENLQMPKEEIRLIEETAGKNPNTVVILFCGAPVETPWLDKVKGVLYMGLPGQAGGEAVKNLLYGVANPSGRLAETWPLEYKDCPSAEFYPQRDGQYREGIYIGYRYYDKAQVPVRWQFGYGLSYTTFSYSKPELKAKKVQITVTNTGTRSGGEVCQLYIAPPQDSIHRPIRELKGFKKVFLEPGESRKVCFNLNERSFAVWAGKWVVPKGDYTILVGGKPNELLTVGTITKVGEELTIPSYQQGSWYETLKGSPSQGEWEGMLGRKYTKYKLQKGQFTMNNTVMEMKEHSLVMKIMYWGVKRTISKGAKPGTPEFRMLMESSAGSPLRSMQISGGMDAKLFEGLLAMANGRYIKKITKS